MRVSSAEISMLSKDVQLIGVLRVWKVQANEKFRGDFVANTSHPLLLIGNTLGQSFVV